MAQLYPLNAASFSGNCEATPLHGSYPLEKGSGSFGGHRYGGLQADSFRRDCTASGKSGAGGVEALLFPKWGERITFGMNPESNCIDIRAARDSTSCCGVNLLSPG
jgi:hypothetical protein